VLRRVPGVRRRLVGVGRMLRQLDPMRRRVHRRVVPMGLRVVLPVRRVRWWVLQRMRRHVRTRVGLVLGGMVLRRIVWMVVWLVTILPARLAHLRRRVLRRMVGRLRRVRVVAVVRR